MTSLRRRNGGVQGGSKYPYIGSPSVSSFAFLSQPSNSWRDRTSFSEFRPPEKRYTAKRAGGRSRMTTDASLGTVGAIAFRKDKCHFRGFSLHHQDRCRHRNLSRGRIVACDITKKTTKPVVCPIGRGGGHRHAQGRIVSNLKRTVGRANRVRRTGIACPRGKTPGDEKTYSKNGEG